MFQGKFNQQVPDPEAVSLVMDNLKRLLQEGKTQGREVFVIIGLTDKEEVVPVSVWGKNPEPAHS